MGCVGCGRRARARGAAFQVEEPGRQPVRGDLLRLGLVGNAETPLLGRRVLRDANRGAQCLPRRRSTRWSLVEVDTGDAGQVVNPPPRATPDRRDRSAPLLSNILQVADALLQRLHDRPIHALLALHPRLQLFDHVGHLTQPLVGHVAAAVRVVGEGDRWRLPGEPLLEHPLHALAGLAPRGPHVGQLVRDPRLGGLHDALQSALRLLQLIFDMLCYPALHLAACGGSRIPTLLKRGACGGGGPEHVPHSLLAQVVRQTLLYVDDVPLKLFGQPLMSAVND
mmetsp:Transcript_124382/g.348370  ORF Transcript_124382/g.348370 Transcript_124382/m.348370 type:complete len:281 (+) Transcript_124382:2868-3710(+)